MLETEQEQDQDRAELPISAAADGLIISVSHHRSAPCFKVVKALHQAQQQMRAATKDKVNSYNSSRYSSFAEIMEVTREACEGTDLAILQTPGLNDAALVLETVLMVDDQFISNVISVPLSAVPRPKEEAKNLAHLQGYSAAWNYLKRVALCIVLGIASEDEASQDQPQNGKKLPADTMKKALETKPDAATTKKPFKVESGKVGELTALCARAKNAGLSEADYTEAIKAKLGSSDLRSFDLPQFNQALAVIKAQIEKAEKATE